MRINNWGSSIIIIVIMSPAIPVPPTRGTQIIYTEIQADIKSYCKRRLTEHTDNDPLKRYVEKPSETSTSISVVLQGILGIAPAVTCVGQKKKKKKKPWSKETPELCITQTRLSLSSGIRAEKATPGAVPLTALIRAASTGALGTGRNHSERRGGLKEKQLANDELCIKGQRHQ